MEQIIKISDNNGQKAVSAFELYKRLGFNITNFHRWKSKNITENEYAIHGIDWFELVLNDEKEEVNSSFEASKANNIVLSIDFAKRLAMLARTEAGEMIRRYFIEVEKQAVRQNNTALLFQMQEIEYKIETQTGIRNKANEELRFLSKMLKNTKAEIYGQLPRQTELSNSKQLALNFGGDVENANHE